MNLKRFYISGLIITSLIIGYWLYNQTFSNQKGESSPAQQQESQAQDNIHLTEVTKDCNGTVTPSLTEGPYYKSGSPKRTNLQDEAIAGIKLTATGYVFDTNCQPVALARLDFWQADGNGNYDNVGYKLRGHQYTDSSGKYVLETVIPGRYSSRTPHIHVKIRSDENSSVLTSQLFLPQEPLNQQDTIFNQSLVMKVQDTPDGKSAAFNFVIIK